MLAILLTLLATVGHARGECPTHGGSLLKFHLEKYHRVKSERPKNQTHGCQPRLTRLGRASGRIRLLRVAVAARTAVGGPTAPSSRRAEHVWLWEVLLRCLLHIFEMFWGASRWP